MSIQQLKDQVQETHRDLTKHHSLINTDTMGDILDTSVQMDRQISSEYSAVELMRAMFEEVGITKAMRILKKYSDNTVYKCNPALLLRLISILLSFP